MTPDTDPPPLLSDTERARMLTDIARVALAAAAGALGPGPWQDLDIARGTGTAHHGPQERLGFIRAVLPALTQAVAEMAQSPIVRAQSAARRVAPPARARRVERAALLHAARHGCHPDRGHGGEPTSALVSGDAAP